MSTRVEARSVHWIQALAMPTRWAARLTSIGAIAFIVADSLTPDHAPSPWHAIVMAVLPVGIIAGLLGGWWNERVGGALAILSLAITALWQFQFERGVAAPVYYLVSLVPAVLFACSALIHHAYGDLHESRL